MTIRTMFLLIEVWNVILVGIRITPSVIFVRFLKWGFLLAKEFTRHSVLLSHMYNLLNVQ
jgi:hypothetical protein